MARVIDAQTCPRCGVKARFDLPHEEVSWDGGFAVLAVCQGCGGPAFAHSQRGPQARWQILYPTISTLAPEGCPDEVRDNFERGRVFDALKVCRSLFAIEDGILAQAGRTDNPDVGLQCEVP